MLAHALSAVLSTLMAARSIIVILVEGMRAVDIVNATLTIQGDNPEDQLAVQASRQPDDKPEAGTPTTSQPTRQKAHHQPDHQADCLTTSQPSKLTA